MGPLPRLRLFTGARVRTGSLLVLVALFAATALAISGLAKERRGSAEPRTDAPGAAAPGAAPTGASSGAPGDPADERGGIFTLDHLIFVVQENRSFDHYFGTYPGADGFEMAGGEPTNCVPDPVLGRESCVYHTSTDEFRGGPHSRPAALADMNGGAMDGFIAALPSTDRWCVDRSDAACATFLGPEQQPDVMSYLTRQDIPNYWAYADAFVLQDRMFAPTDGWTLPAHLFLVSGWSAYCYDPADPMSCVSNVDLKEESQRFEYGEDPIYAWTDITWLLDRGGVSWGYYVAPGTCSFPPCHGERIDGPEGSTTTASRNPLPGFATLHETGQLDHILDYEDFERSARRGTLPSVSWVVPGDRVSEHPQSSRGVSAGMAHVTRIVNSVMRGPLWDSSAIFITWDDWGGFYDHVLPPLADENGYGLRVPGLLVSPYARRGYIDHQLLTFDAYLKLIEDRFLGGQRLDPATDGRPDSRPVVRENLPILGDLALAFNFDRRPRPPLILDPTPP
ncbi:MAG: alkaline phosphatase family protein [Actinomycetota bacterium]